MKVLIAEDELLERKAMRKFLEDNFTDLTVVGEAVNGRRAIEMAEELQPNVILMDIKMPGINGLEAIESIHEKNPGIKFILVSAYDSFAYAKQAMKMGVKEYILKPSKKEETIRAVLRVKKEVKEEQARTERTRNSSLIAKELFLTKLMKNEIGNDTKELQQTLFPLFRSAFFLAASDERLSGKAIDEWISQITDDKWIYRLEEGQLIIAVISESVKDKAAVLKLARRLQMQLGDDAYVGAGYPAERLEDLPNCYHQALQAVKHLEQMGNSKFGFPPVEFSRNSILEDILLEVVSGSDTIAQHFLAEMWQNKHAKTELLQELFFRLKQELQKRDIQPPETAMPDMDSYQDWAEYIKLASLNVQHHFQSQDKIERAKKFIHDHYHEPISLEDVSFRSELSPNYFSNLFKESTGETFIDYLTHIRLLKAKEFLQSNKYSLKEICFMVGYKDPNYFSRVFKKYFSLSPKQYQKKILKK
ncbi:response regulator [Sediminibacillus albus]|uniref:Two-component system, response regulator YesN n=1 Tax=Sediminibacillus albus TaxID=407036 RepID=A0A1G8YLD0_9BACI|nr:response regulator [Sediminibacillus albus]SDK02965.1 two-component system, response regulator YesN [Sediminibacillus albus]